MNIAPKTAGAGAGGTFSIALVEILAWLLSFWDIVIPAGVGAAFATVFATLGAYFSPHHELTKEEIAKVIADNQTQSTDTLVPL